MRSYAVYCRARARMFADTEGDVSAFVTPRAANRAHVRSAARDYGLEIACALERCVGGRIEIGRSRQ